MHRLPAQEAEDALQRCAKHVIANSLPPVPTTADQDSLEVDGEDVIVISDGSEGTSRRRIDTGSILDGDDDCVIVQDA